MLDLVMRQDGRNRAVSREQPCRLQKFKLDEVVLLACDPSPNFCCHSWVRVLGNEHPGLHAEDIASVRRSVAYDDVHSPSDGFDTRKVASFVIGVDEREDVDAVLPSRAVNYLKCTGRPCARTQSRNKCRHK